MQTPLPPDNLTKFLAAWGGALLGTFGLGWTLYRDLLDRAKLQVSASVRKIARRKLCLGPSTYGCLMVSGLRDSSLFGCEPGYCDFDGGSDGAAPAGSPDPGAPSLSPKFLARY